MNRTPVQSSNIASIGYDEGEKVLEVEFHSGAVYQYEDVPPEVHGDFMNASSAGRFFSENIRGIYLGARVPE